MIENNESIDENKSKVEQKELLLERHRLERKQLNAKITELRHSLTKGDKKRKKELNSEIDLMTEMLKTKHENELKDLLIDSDFEKQCLDGLSDELNQICVNQSKAVSELSFNGIKYKETKISKAQRKRDSKALKQKLKQKEIEEGMVSDSDNERLIEAQKLANILESRGLALREMSSDGDCMYRAIGHQLSLKNISINVSELRQKTCDYMKDNKQEFIPFLTSSSSGDMMNDEEYELYCDEIAGTKTWGGQLELRAVSHIFRVPIEVIQAEGNGVVIGLFEYKSEEPLILCYHRRAYSLGEHYNSVDKISLNCVKSD